VLFLMFMLVYLCPKRDYSVRRGPTGERAVVTVIFLQIATDDYIRIAVFRPCGTSWIHSRSVPFVACQSGTFLSHCDPQVLETNRSFCGRRILFVGDLLQLPLSFLIFNARRVSTHNTFPILDFNSKISNPTAHESYLSVVG
jgi:hypothetical protein